ncbi:MAG TPA: PKD domain-containing protein [Solirubrobacteraceae bacterium]|nr:PKD domain-containing protein [Solirubrobacteraceae bacterium]
MLLLALLAPAGALAAPANDDFASATPVVSLPFTDAVDTAGATIETGEPQFCHFVENSVWYAVTPSADATLTAASTGISWSQLSVYRQDGSGLGGLSFMGCENFGSEPVAARVKAGETYYVQGSTLFGSTGQLRIEIKEVQPPPNDHFADAKPIGSVPFADEPLLTAATAEDGEPTACAGAGQKTVWYAFTPSKTDSYRVSRSSWGVAPLAVYTGDSLGSLEQVACASWSSAIFRAQAGTTYYLQLAAGHHSSSPVHISLDAAPPAVASFFYHPSEPSSLDDVQFHGHSWDEAGIAAWAWGFGDGATAVGCCPSHRYAADGDYRAELEITTNDGRTASTAHDVAVRTHDVAITKLSVPKSARVGQTARLSVGVSNTRYAETVEVALLRSVPGGGGFEQVGQVTQGVPVRTGGRTTSFTIGYTFGPDDATLGKVSFQAVATLVGARDAYPADNAIVALPTTVGSR